MSGEPQPHWPGAVLFGSEGQRSLQSSTASPSTSLSLSTTPQPHGPTSTLLGSVGQASRSPSEKKPPATTCENVPICAGTVT